MTTQKILTEAKAAALSAAAHKAGKTVVTVNGVFDMLSVPHMLLIEKAKEQGDIVIVGVNSDVSVHALKGPKRPIVSEKERAMLVAGLAVTDAVFLFDDLDPRRWLPIIKPQVHVNSAEFTEECIEAKTLQEIGAKLVLVPRNAEYPSTSDVIETIVTRYCA